MWKVVFVFLAAFAAVGEVSLVGGFRDIDPNNESAQNAIRFAVAAHNRGLNDMYLRNVIEVIEAKSQVVAGMKYILKVKLGKTSCRKMAADEQCPVNSDPKVAKPYTCTFTVWSRPWLNNIELLKQEC